MSRPTSSSTPSPQGPHFTDYLRVVYKRRWTAGLAFLVVFASGTISTLKKPQIYEATAKVLIEKEARRSTSINSVLDDQQSWYDDDFYKTQYEILRSRRLAWRAVQALGLVRPAGPAAAPAQGPSWLSGLSAWASGLVGAPPKIAPPAANETTVQSTLIDGFVGGLAVEPVRQTHLVNVSYRSRDPEFAAKAANTIAHEYIQEGLLGRLESSKETSDFLSGQLEEQRRKVEESERALQEYKEKNDAVALDDRATAVVQQYSDVSAKAAQATGDRIDKQAKYDRFVTLQKSGDRDSLLGAIGADPTILTMQTELRKAEAERDQVQGPGVPARVSGAQDRDRERQCRPGEARRAGRPRGRRRPQRVHAGAAARARLHRAAQSEEVRTDAAEQQERRVQGAVARGPECAAGVRHAAPDREPDRDGRRLQGKQHPDRRRRGSAEMADPAEHVARSHGVVPGRLPAGDRPGVRLRVPGQPDQDAGRSEDAPRPSVPRAGARRSGQGRGADPAAGWQRARELQRGAPRDSHVGDLLVGRRGIAVDRDHEHGAA